MKLFNFVLVALVFTLSTTTCWSEDASVQVSGAAQGSTRRGKKTRNRNGKRRKKKTTKKKTKKVKKPKTVAPTQAARDPRLDCAQCPDGYFDGCNNCMCFSPSGSGACTRKLCSPTMMKKPFCREKDNQPPATEPPVPADPCSRVKCTKGTVCREGKCVDDGPVMCPMDVKECPDGSYVSRQGRECAFAPCPTAPDLCMRVVCPEGSTCKDGKCVQEAPSEINCKTCPLGYNDGCNDCRCSDGEILGFCTRKLCFTQGTPRCRGDEGAQPPATEPPVPADPCSRVKCTMGTVCREGKCVDDGPVMCPMDVKECPDGSYVSRQGRECAFAPCPTAPDLCMRVVCPEGSTCKDGKCVQEAPSEINCKTCPLGYNDGCNDCRCSDGEILGLCTRKFCFTQGTPRCRGDEGAQPPATEPPVPADPCSRVKCTMGTVCREGKCVDDGPVMCPMDVKECPDGSYVSRQGRECAFAPCPIPCEKHTDCVSCLMAGCNTLASTQYFQCVQFVIMDGPPMWFGRKNMRKEEAAGMCDAKYRMEDRMKNCDSATTCEECLETLESYQCRWGRPEWSENDEASCSAEPGGMIPMVWWDRCAASPTREYPEFPSVTLPPMPPLEEIPGRPIIAIGRPFSLTAGANDDLVADVLGCQKGDTCFEESSWSLQSDSDEVPHLSSSLSQQQRKTAAAHWMHAGAMEHASVASFSRFSLDLMAVGAPADLIVSTHLAALDEIRHAQLSFSVASLFNGTSQFKPDKFTIPDATVQIAKDLPSMVARTLAEGCIGETLAAIRAFYAASTIESLDQQARQKEEPFASSVLSAVSSIAVDEARHAALAWKTVEWAMSQQDEASRQAVLTATKKLSAHPPTENYVLPPHFPASMPLSDATIDVLHSQAIHELIIPALDSIAKRQKYKTGDITHPAILVAAKAIFT